MRISRFVTATLTLAATSTLASAQGTDTCTTPQSISGSGPFAFTTGTTGAEGQNNANCNLFGAIGIGLDVWYVWTAPSSGNFDVSTCGGSNLDTKIAVYDGTTCPVSPALACNDDLCGTQTTTTFAATAGSSYVIQLGLFPGGGPGTGGGSGTFTVAVNVPPPPCSNAVGPDVIVGDLTGPANHNMLGTLDAISLGTVSCNLGSTNLSWLANVNQHPVIGGNLYRYRVVAGSGRFEQIGMSWLKHGFTALSQNLCCPSCAPTDGTSLGVGCSDPYTAQRNGTQNPLGPRYQVNAHTGAYAYPPATGTGFTGSTARRCEFLLADVDTSVGVRYFGESQYVTPDDAAANNQNNNASYRELSATLPGGTSGSAFAFVGSTVRQKSAIDAWQVVDPTVTLNYVQIPGDGLFKVGCKTTDLGGGQYHYEYAVYNMNADRNGGSFTIPLPAGVTITNVDFHDVTYRNGDGNGNVSFSGLDWAVTQTATSITWACEAEGVNANANALRWGTTYNFRFDANAAPTSGLATLGLWKAGLPGNVTTSLDVPAGASTTAAYCFGDGSGTACPCGNNSVAGAGQGCLNSSGLGTVLAGTGASSVSADTFVLQVTNLPIPALPPNSVLLFQGSAQSSTTFGDGLLCVTGTQVRLGIKSYSGSSASYPGLFDTSVSVKGLLPPTGGVRYYQAWHRDASTPCGSNTNLSNALAVTWSP